MSDAVLEDRKFFIKQYLHTFPLNLVSLVVKFINGTVWAILDNAKLLGFFSLASTPSSICQRAATAGGLAQTILPNKKTTEEDQSIIQTAILIDMMILGVVILVNSLFFVLTKADIIRNLGLATFLILSLITLVEPIFSMALHTCNAKRHYGWNFMLGNIRLISAIGLLVFVYLNKISSSRWGVFIWVASTFTTVLLALYYFRHFNIRIFSIKHINKEFVALLRRNTIGLISYRVSTIFVGSLASFLIAYMQNPHDIGAFSFALTLSGFLYSAIVPINEQIYSPTFSRLINQNQFGLLMRRLLQMLSATLLITVVCSIPLLVFGRPILVFFHKLAFLESFKFLPILILYQALLMMGSGFGYSLYCMNRFKSLSYAQFIAAAAALGWAFVFRGNVFYVLWSLPLSALMAGLIYFVRVQYLVLAHRPLIVPSEQIKI